VLDRLTGVEAHPDLERHAVREVGGGPLLHRRRAPDGTERAPEHGHEAVAECLDLRSVVLVDGSTHRAEVTAANALGLVVPEPLQELRGADEIREEDDDQTLNQHSQPSRDGTRRCRLAATRS
jgi:hypothetical protein